MLDFEFRFLVDIDPSFEEWRVLAAEWIKTQKTQTNKKNTLITFFIDYLHHLQLDKSPATFLLATNQVPSLWEKINIDQPSPAEIKNKNDCICDFLEWTLREKFSVTEADGNRVVPSPFRNPFTRMRKKVLFKIDDIEFSYLIKQDPSMEEWRALACEWVDSQRYGTNLKRAALDKFLLGYILKLNLDRNPYRFLRRDSQRPQFFDVLVASKSRSISLTRTTKPTKGNIERNNSIHEFLSWVLIEKLSIENDSGHQVIPHEFDNPVPKLSKTGMMQSETLKTPLPYRYIQQLRTLLSQGPTFRDWIWAQQAMEKGNAGGDWFVVEPTLPDPNDPDCVWRKRQSSKYEKKIQGYPPEIVEIWSPVRAVALYIKLELPLRTFQVRMLDSGEADTWRFESGKWKINDSPLTTGSEKRPYQRGVFHRSTNEVGAGFFINTNKTADIHKDEIDKGYTIPWTYEPALFWLEKLRNWQERYNPITEPTPWRILEAKHFGGTPPHSALLEERGSVCFLFRDATAKAEGRQKPIYRNCLDRLWYRLLAELEASCEASGLTLDDGSPIRFVDLDSNKSTLYPLHALRVSLITAFALEGGVPFPILSKLIAGHSRLIMTLYYTKAGKAYVTEVMQEAERRMLENETSSHRRFLMEKTYQEIEQRFAYVNADALQAAKQQKSAAGFVFEDKGICPMGGALCDVGGELLKEKKTESNQNIFSPVVGYPQERNCVRCRYFLTGPAFLPGLQAHFNEISYKTTECSERYVHFEHEVRILEDERCRCEEHGWIFTKHKELESLYQRYEAEAEKANKLLIDFQACVRLIHRCTEIAKETFKDGILLVSSGDISDIQYALTETTSEMNQLEVMCENSVIFPEVDAGKAVLRRSQVLDAMLQLNGKPPIFFSLTPEQQLQVGNEVMKLIQARTGSLNYAVEFAEGRRLLNDLGLLDETFSLIEERTGGVSFRQVIDNARRQTSDMRLIEANGNDT